LLKSEVYRNQGSEAIRVKGFKKEFGINLKKIVNDSVEK